jgi:2,4-dienoyl-CoA reductase-like NADH-dependent reductase (Old Yellow Enzyme family)
MNSQLFEPLRLRELTLSNRIVIEPMTMFSAPEGVAGDWHLMHLGQLAMAGASLLFNESTYVAPESRNSPWCFSLYNDEQEAGLRRIVDFIHRHTPTAFGVQLNHAGRKASTRRPWEAGEPFLHVSEGGYQPVGPSTLPLRDGWPVPRELSTNDVQTVVEQFRQAAVRARNAGTDVVEVHAAHGYLLHQFLSPLSNVRTDEYGGSFENRIRLVLEVFDSVRKEWPADRPLGVRVSATDWAEGGWQLEDTLELARLLDERGCDFIDVSSGGLTPAQQITTGPGYQTGFAAAVKEAVEMAVITVGEISDPIQAESILRTGQADLIGIARAALANPRWPWAAAERLNADAHYPPQYALAHPSRRRTSPAHARMQERSTAR